MTFLYMVKPSPSFDSPLAGKQPRRIYLVPSKSSINSPSVQDDAILAQPDPSIEDSHGISADDWLPGHLYGPRAAIRAAGKANPEILRTPLKHNDDHHAYLHEDNEYGPNATDPPDMPGYTTALLQAINYQRRENVTTLLSAGADPNGLSLAMLSQNAAGFLRLGPHFAESQDYNMKEYDREYLLTFIPTPQLSLLIQEEVEERFHCRIPSRFWSEARFRTLSPVENADMVPALIAAAVKIDQTILKSLLDAPGTDTSFWTTTPHPRCIPVEATPSSLAVTTPLHAAISARNFSALSVLLFCGFNPNVLPLAAPTRCISPAMATIVYCDPWNADAYKTLKGHPLIDWNIRMPVYNVSILHFAVARLNLRLLQTVAADVPLFKAGITALGHTLLHIACLPLDESWVQIHSEPIYRSCHETRNLSELRIVEEGEGDYLKAEELQRERDHGAWLVRSSRGHPLRFSKRPARETVQDCHRRQIEVVDYLL